MRKSPSISAIAEALTKVQAQLTPVARDGDNLSFNSKYSTIVAITEQIRPLATTMRLSYSQEAIIDGSLVQVTTLIMHPSGEWLETDFELPTSPLIHQAAAAATMAKRYGLASAFGVVSEHEDTDAQELAPPPPIQYTHSVTKIAKVYESQGEGAGWKLRFKGENGLSFLTRDVVIGQQVAEAHASQVLVELQWFTGTAKHEVVGVDACAVQEPVL